MSIKSETLEAIRLFFCDADIDEDWSLRHISIEVYDNGTTVIITVDNMEDQEYKWIKETL